MSEITTSTSNFVAFIPETDIDGYSLVEGLKSSNKNSETQGSGVALRGGEAYGTNPEEKRGSPNLPIGTKIPLQNCSWEHEKTVADNFLLIELPDEQVMIGTATIAQWRLLENLQNIIKQL